MNGCVRDECGVTVLFFLLSPPQRRFTCKDGKRHGGGGGAAVLWMKSGQLCKGDSMHGCIHEFHRISSYFVLFIIDPTFVRPEWTR